MGPIRLIAAGLASVAGLAAVAVATHAAPRAQDPAPADRPKAEARPAFDKAARYEGYLMATIGNMKPEGDPAPFALVSREAILYKDGTVKLFEIDAKDPVVPTIRHDGPIREMNILDEARLLVTSSDDTIKLWDGLTGEPVKTIKGHVARPLFFARDNGAGRIATVDLDGRVVTLWNTKTFEPVATIRPDGAAKVLGAGLSKDGRTLATIGEDRVVTLRDAAAGRPFATIQAPSPLAARCFVEREVIGDHLQLDDRFWEGVQPLLPEPTSPKVK